MTGIWVEITATRGSAPRDAGTAMRVTPDRTQGTIGGGALEYRAIHTARRMLAEGSVFHEETIPLGPGLGQCCGGAVSLRYSDREPDEAFAEEAPALPPSRWHGKLWLWGAGHVGRAVVAAAPPGSFDITWIDNARDRFPDAVPAHVAMIPAADMPLLATRADRDADHFIFTYSHDIDLALCAALLRRGVRSCGLIGSDTKWARFRKRLSAMGLDPSPITCPIGDKRLGKAPDRIARGVVANLLAEDRMTA